MEKYSENMGGPQIKHTLDSLFEGVQIIDFNWNYLYVNSVIAENDPNKKDFHGITVLEKYPGIEHTELFAVVKKCMFGRESYRLEVEFVYENSLKWFEIKIIPVEDGICVISLDITERKIAEEKNIKHKRIYAFISQINQMIVRLDNEADLFKNSCRIAIDFGKFQMAWIGLFDEDRKSICITDHSGIPKEDIHLFTNTTFKKNGPLSEVLKTGTNFISNDVSNDVKLKDWKLFFQKHGIQSMIVMPIRKSGNIIGVFNLYATSLYLPPDEIALLTELAGDISFALDLFEKSKRHALAEEQIIKNEKRFRALIEKSSDIKTLSDGDGKVLYASTSIKKVLGYTPKEFMLHSLLDLFHPDDAGFVVTMREKLLTAPGKSISRQLRLRHKDGNWIWCDATITNMMHESGIEALVSNFTDISDKKISVQQHEFDRNNLDAIINNTNDLMWSVDTNFNLITSNIQFKQMVNLFSGKSIEKGNNTMSFAFSEAQKLRYHQYYERALSGETFTETEYNRLPAEFWTEISFYPIRENQKVIGTACNARDITKRKKSELKLKNQNKELLKTNHELDRFVYSVSHDLRSPLTSMLGLISFIEEDSQETTTLQHLAMIKSSILRLDASIKNILSYSYNNRAELEVSVVPVAEMVNQIIGSLSNMQHADQILFDVDIDEPEDFYTDKQRFSTILENLISNAIKYHSGGADQFIKISGETDSKTLKIKIQDNGIGIAPEDHERVFEMFQRLSGNVPGSGIGLYLVKETIAKLHGTFKMESAIGIGTTFELRFDNLS